MFRKKLAKLIDLKSIITIVLTITLSTIIFAGIEIADEAIKTLLVSVTSSVFTYYFTKKPSKTEDTEE
jgi:hypothetical protein